MQSGAGTNPSCMLVVSLCGVKVKLVGVIESIKRTGVLQRCAQNIVRTSFFQGGPTWCKPLALIGSISYTIFKDAVEITE